MPRMSRVKYLGNSNVPPGSFLDMRAKTNCRVIFVSYSLEYCIDNGICAYFNFWCAQIKNDGSVQILGNGISVMMELNGQHMPTFKRNVIQRGKTKTPFSTCSREYSWAYRSFAVLIQYAGELISYGTFFA